jgi:hypothetical protein
MNYVPDHQAFSPYIEGDLLTFKAIPKKRGILRRISSAILEAMGASRRRQAELEIERFVARQGRCMSDDLERRLNRCLFASDWKKRE